MRETEGGPLPCCVRTCPSTERLRVTNLDFSRHTRAEYKEGQQRPLNRTYYFIDYRATIDAIKYRIWLMDKDIQGTTIAQEDRKEYSCRRCKAQWTAMQVIDNFDPSSGFLCHTCGFLLDMDDGGDQTGHEQSTKYNAQFKFITDLLPKLDQVIIPESTFEKAFDVAVKVERDATNPAYETAPVETSTNKPSTVHGLSDTGPTTVSVTLTTGEGPSAADKAADLAKKEKTAAQNALPTHFTHSTVTGEQVKFGPQPTYQTSQLEVDKKGGDTPSANGDDAGIDDYFAQLKAEAAREAEKELDEEDTDDEEEEEFEDVPSGSGAATPAISVSNAGEEEVPAAKKVKIEEREESDEDLEFEDV